MLDWNGRERREKAILITVRSPKHGVGLRRGMDVTINGATFAARLIPYRPDALKNQSSTGIKKITRKRDQEYRVINAT